MGFELIGFIKSMGYMGSWAIIFAESGILFGVVLPGDTLLFGLGVLAHQGYFNITLMLLGCFFSAFLGNLLGYEIGKRYGLPFARQYARRFVSKGQLDATHAFFNKHGVMTVVLARFLPVVRTVAPFIAGISHMRYRLFVLHSAIGALIWACGLPLAGFFFGKFIPDGWMEFLLIPIILVAIAVFVSPYLLRYLKKKKWKRK